MKEEYHIIMSQFIGNNRVDLCCMEKGALGIAVNDKIVMNFVGTTDKNNLGANISETLSTIYIVLESAKS